MYRVFQPDFRKDPGGLENLLAHLPPDFLVVQKDAEHRRVMHASQTTFTPIFGG
jgi:hypothetical protein